jgi:hypothetical protein
MGDGHFAVQHLHLHCQQLQAVPFFTLMRQVLAVSMYSNLDNYMKFSLKSNFKCILSTV